MSKGKWKHNLLSSGLPLEYAVAGTLVENGFSVSADYAYTEFNPAGSRSLSVDIGALDIILEDDSEWAVHFELLVECK